MDKLKRMVAIWEKRGYLDASCIKMANEVCMCVCVNVCVHNGDVQVRDIWADVAGEDSANGGSCVVRTHSPTYRDLTQHSQLNPTQFTSFNTWPCPLPPSPPSPLTPPPLLAGAGL